MQPCLLLIADFVLSVWVFFCGFYKNAVIFPPLYFWPHIAVGQGDADASKILTPVKGTQHGPHKTEKEKPIPQKEEVKNTADTKNNTPLIAPATPHNNTSKTKTKSTENKPFDQ